MSSRRLLKAAEAIREVVATAVLMQIRDPRVCNVTVTFVEVSGDMRHAKVHVSVLGDEKVQRLSLQGLRSSAGFLQEKIARRIDTRYTPKLQFVLDKGSENAEAINRILEEVLPKEAPDTARDDAITSDDTSPDLNAGGDDPPVETDSAP